MSFEEQLLWVIRNFEAWFQGEVVLRPPVHVVPINNSWGTVNLVSTERNWMRESDNVLIAYRSYHYAIHHSGSRLKWTFRLCSLYKMGSLLKWTFRRCYDDYAMLRTKGLHCSLMAIYIQANIMLVYPILFFTKSHESLYSIQNFNHETNWSKIRRLLLPLHQDEAWPYEVFNSCHGLEPH